jgi:glycosyltransferase involved in cell wall biosynthesis
VGPSSERHEDAGKGLKIQLLISSLGFGGAERVASLLANAWCRMHHQVLLTTFDSPQAETAYAVDPGVRRVSLDLYRPSSSAFDAVTENVKRIRALRSSINAFRPDIVISFMVESNVLIVLAGVMLRTPFIVAEHSDPYQIPRSRVWRCLRFLTYRNASKIIVLNERARKYFSSQMGLSAEVIPNPVFVDDRNYRHAERASRRRVIMGMGRLDEEKRFDLLIAAFFTLQDKHPDWDLLIVGDGPLKTGLTERCREYGLGERVRFLGVTKAPQKWMQRSDIFVLSSSLEGFPMALCEAMACGMAVVSTRYNDGVNEIVENGASGLLVPVDDLDALTDAMDALMSDANLRKKLGDAAKRIVDRYGIEPVMQNWQSVLLQTL